MKYNLFLQKYSVDLLTGLFFTILIAGAFLAWPSADDFCYYSRANINGPLDMLREEYFGWGGRYSSTIIMGILSQLPYFITGGSFFVVPLIIVASICCGTHVLLRYGFDDKSYRKTLLGSMILIAALSWRESIFWMAGGITYGLSIGVSLAVAGLLLGLERINKPVFFLLAFLIFINAGFNEGIPLFQIGFLALMLLKSWFYNKKQLLPFGILMLVALTGLMIEYMAPGNFVRSGAISNEVKFTEGLNGFIYPFNYSLHALCFFLLWSCIWALVPLKQIPDWLPRNPWIILGATYLLLLPSLFVRALMLSGPGPDRVLSIDIFIVWLGMMALTLSIQTGIQKLSRPIIISLFLCVFLAMPTASSSSSIEQITQLAKYAPKVNKVFKKRLESYLESPTQEITVDALRTKWALSPTVMNDVTEDNSNWINGCVAKAYGVTSVRLNSLVK